MWYVCACAGACSCWCAQIMCACVHVQVLAHAVVHILHAGACCHCCALACKCNCKHVHNMHLHGRPAIMQHACAPSAPLHACSLPVRSQCLPVTATERILPQASIQFDAAKAAWLAALPMHLICDWCHTLLGWKGTRVLGLRCLLAACACGA